MSTAVFVGLGNPEPDYTNTRHNIGFYILNAWVSKYGGSWVKDTKLKSLLAKIVIQDKSVLLVKPQTYMNHSGESVLAVKSYFNISPEDFIIIHDDVEVNLGNYKVTLNQISAKGHNGVKSIHQLLKFPVARVRVGIGPKPEGCNDISNYVLGKFEKGEQALVDENVLGILERLEEIVKKGIVNSRN